MPNATSENRKAQRHRARARKRHWVGLYKMSHGCADCGWVPEDGDHSQLDLDHLPGHDKVWDVSNMISAGWGWERIRTEVRKCEVVCRPCHQERTSVRHWAKVGRTPPTDLPDPY